jgi:hypothetical protein
MTSSLLYKSLLICYLKLLGCTLAGNTNGVTWLFPTTDQILHYEDTVNVTWTSHFSSPLLYTFCFNSTNNFAIQGISSLYLSSSSSSSRISRGVPGSHTIQRISAHTAGMARYLELQFRSEAEYHGWKRCQQPRIRRPAFCQSCCDDGGIGFTA